MKVFDTRRISGRPVLMLLHETEPSIVFFRHVLISGYLSSESDLHSLYTSQSRVLIELSRSARAKASAAEARGQPQGSDCWTVKL